MRFENKVVLVTGANSGIGQAIAYRFAKEGANLAIFDIKECKSNVVEGECKKNKKKCLNFKIDITIETEIKRAVAQIIEEFGQLDILVNNAGIFKFLSFLDETFMDSFDKILKTNLRSTVLLTHWTAQHLIKTKGNIVNIASMSAHKPCSNNIPYDVSKMAVKYFTECAALELASTGVRVNSVSPGMVNTIMMENNGMNIEECKTHRESVRNSTPLKRLIEPEEIAEVVANLASDKSKNITGTNVLVDGGFTLI